MYCSTPGYGSATGLHLGELTNCLKDEKNEKKKKRRAYKNIVRTRLGCSPTSQWHL